MMKEQHLKKLYRLFRKKMPEVFENKYNPDSFVDNKITEFSGRRSRSRHTAHPCSLRACGLLLYPPLVMLT